MTKIDELMALVADNFQATEYNSHSKLRTALEAALKPGEPVAYLHHSDCGASLHFVGHHMGMHTPLYIAPPAQTPEPDDSDMNQVHAGNAMVSYETINYFSTPPTQTPVPPRLTDEHAEYEWERVTGHSVFGGSRSDGRAMYISPDEVVEFAHAIETAVRKQFGVNDE